MALPGSGIVNQGLQRLGRNASGVNGTGTSGTFGGTLSMTRYVMVMSVDDNASNFAAADVALNTSRGAITTEVDQLLDSQPTISSQTTTHIMTLGTGTFNGSTVKGIALHDDVAGTVTSSSSTLVAGIAGQSLLKTASFSLALTLTVLYTDNS